MFKVGDRVRVNENVEAYLHKQEYSGHEDIIYTITHNNDVTSYCLNQVASDIVFYGDELDLIQHANDITDPVYDSCNKARFKSGDMVKYEGFEYEITGIQGYYQNKKIDFTYDLGDELEDIPEKDLLGMSTVDYNCLDCKYMNSGTYVGECIFDNSSVMDPGGYVCCSFTHKKHSDPVNQPSHYTQGKYEVIDVIEDWGLSKSFCLANAVKYIARAEHKGKQIEDIKKAIWYLKRELKNLGDDSDVY